MLYELHLTVAEMNLIIPAVESYIKFIENSKTPSVKANAKSKIEKLKKTSEKLSLLLSYAKISTQAEKVARQAATKKRRYDDLVSGNNKTVEELLSGDLDQLLKID